MGFQEKGNHSLAAEAHSQSLGKAFSKRLEDYSIVLYDFPKKKIIWKSVNPSPSSWIFAPNPLLVMEALVHPFTQNPA